MKLIAAVPNNFNGSHGESFIWKKSDNCVIVDAGKNKIQGLYSAKFRPDVLILSHDDHDHIGGAESLITASTNLKELWIPYEWGLLLSEIAEFIKNYNIQESRTFRCCPVCDYWGCYKIIEKLLEIDIEEKGERLFSEGDFHSGELLKNLSLDSFEKIDEMQYIPEKMRERVKRRGKVILKIINAAINRNVVIRFFSVDAAKPGMEPWKKSGNPGNATILNAVEVFNIAPIVNSSPLHHFYNALALTYLTIQNKRALSVLLWENEDFESQKSIIWSDSDGNWINKLFPNGIKNGIKNVKITSAPHHASGNSSHNIIWNEIKSIKPEVLISAGGQKNQAYSLDYLGHNRKRRSCTWCRIFPQCTCKKNPDYSHQKKQVIASFKKGSWVLNNYCTCH